MASSVGCWTSSSKVGRSGFFSFSHHITCEDVFETHTLIPSPLVGSFGLYIRPCFRILPLLYYDYIPMLFYAFLWVFWVSSSGAFTSGNATFVRRFATFFINSCSYPGQSAAPFAHVASLPSSNIAVISAIFGRRCAAVVGGPDAFWPIVAVSSAGKGRVRLSEALVTLEPRTSALEVT